MDRITIRQKVINELSDLPPSYLEEFYRLLKLFKKGVKKQELSNDYNLKAYHCGGKLKEFSRKDAYNDRI